ncbi:DnaJ domain-containing protein [Toxoplasma gondii VAND]|uniref:DnaJ domain-containing protein n=2 Tax=Toxoplasma gondii TaxID=5811 RepID=V4ZGT4_TOXGV|nr:DnaJ domain-containing protein [Toxoplasma gondii VEG]KFH06902.1 DnaJ domain-containing protein [Toxoplasma gondii VAND]CEL73959.1 TPA: DnaJ domain-containing protein [Toxoplasma gondii VEG]
MEEACGARQARAGSPGTQNSGHNPSTTVPSPSPDPSSSSPSPSCGAAADSDDPFGVRSALDRLRGLSWKSPFRRRSAASSFISAYLAFFFGGCFGLHWFHLACWPRWALRVFTLSGCGLYSLCDFFLLPSAVRASQRRRQRAFVRAELVKRLQAAHRREESAAALSRLEKRAGATSGAASWTLGRSVSLQDLEPFQRGREVLRRQTENLRKQRDEVLRRVLQLSVRCGFRSPSCLGSPAVKQRGEKEKLGGEETPHRLAGVSQTSVATCTSPEEKKETDEGQKVSAPVETLPEAVEAADNGVEKSEQGRNDNEIRAGRDATMATLMVSNTSSSSSSCSTASSSSSPSTAPSPSSPSTSPSPSSPSTSPSPSSLSPSCSASVSAARLHSSGVSASSRFLSGALRPRLSVSERDIAVLLKEQEVGVEVCALPPVVSSTSFASQRGSKAFFFRHLSWLRGVLSFWASLMPWRLLFRGIYAHVLCSFVVDVVFCNAELSPLSAPISRLVFVLLHCLARAAVIFAANFSDLTDMPSPWLCSDLLMCVAASFGGSAILLLGPELLHAVGAYVPIVDAHVRASFSAFFGEFSVLLSLPSVEAQARLPRVAREDFYASCHFANLVVIGVSAYLAAAAHHDEPEEARKREVSFCRDVLALLAVLDREDREALEKKRSKELKPEFTEASASAGGGETTVCQDTVVGGNGPQETKEKKTGGGKDEGRGRFEEDPRMAALVAQAQRTYGATITQSPGDTRVQRVRECMLSALVWFFALAFLAVWVACLVLAASNVAARMEDKTAAKVFAFVSGDTKNDPELGQLKAELSVLYKQFQALQKEKGFTGALSDIAAMLWSEAQEAMSEQRRKQKKKDDAYTLLGVQPSATAREIKMAYKQLARQHHPDVVAAASPEPLTPLEEARATEKMRKINEAYERLMRTHGGRGNLGRV